MAKSRLTTTLERFEVGGQKYGVLRYEFMGELTSWIGFTDAMKAHEVCSVDVRVLERLAEELQGRFPNTGVIWALGPMRLTGSAPVLSKVVTGYVTDRDLEGFVHAQVSAYGVDHIACSGYGFLVQQSAKS